jgi:hypothetical protein
MDSELNDLHSDLDSEGPVSLPPTATRPAASANDAGPSDVPVKRGRGRPKGSKNRPKDANGNPLHAVLGKDNPILQIVINNETELAMRLAQLAAMAHGMAHDTKWEPVAASLGWVSQGSSGEWIASKRCVFGAALCWPYIKESGILDSLDNVPPVVLCILGAIILVGPAVPAAYRVIATDRKKKLPANKEVKEETKK